MEEYRIVLEGGMAQIEEKKSKFIASVFSVRTQEEAAQFIEQTRKKYWDARHHCTAYIIGDKQPIMRCSDDGEPTQTAGRPMLDILMAERLFNVLVVVTRYFGGTLLGTGGLVRAYSLAVKEGLKHSILVEKRKGSIYKIEMDYTDFGKASYLCGQKKISVLNTVYTEVVKLTVILSEKEQEFLERLTEETNGKAKIQKEQDIFYALYNGEIILFTENGSVENRIHSQSL